MDFFKNLLEKYSKIKFPEQYKEIAKADKSISWYLADSTDQFVTISKSTNNNILEIDIRQAFTTICRNLFEPTNDFIIKMNQIEDKKSRNIFIATSLVNTEYLRLLNIISKVIIFGILFEIGEILLLELKKDGALISCDDETLNKITNIADQNSEFIKYVIDHNFEFHVDQYAKYLRSNKTSYLLTTDNDVIVKGIYKHSPSYIKNVQREILLDAYDNFEDLLKIYSTKYYKILSSNNLSELLNGFYICDNKRYLAEDGKYIIKEINNNIDPKNYLKTFIYPLVLSNKL